MATKGKSRLLKREERRRKANHIRSKKRDEVVSKKRALGGSDTAPFLTAVVPLGESANIEGLVKFLRTCDEEAKVLATSRDVIHIK